MLTCSQSIEDCEDNEAVKELSLGMRSLLATFEGKKMKRTIEKITWRAMDELELP